MPIELSELKTKSGHPIVRAKFVSEVTVRDATEYFAAVRAGAKYDGWGHLACGNVTGVSGEVRKVLSSEQTDQSNPTPVAVVLESALARMAASLTMRLSGNANTDSFKDEAEALAWLDGKMKAFVEKRAAASGSKKTG
ncbi:MAG: hypothetical protein JNM17_23805 [Archangium sp.]|nr:hypothetical protein [Archangium sp.]